MIYDLFDLGFGWRGDGNFCEFVRAKENGFGMFPILRRDRSGGKDGERVMSCDKSVSRDGQCPPSADPVSRTEGFDKWFDNAQNIVVPTVNVFEDNPFPLLHCLHQNPFLPLKRTGFSSRGYVRTEKGARVEGCVRQVDRNDVVLRARMEEAREMVYQ